MLLAVTRGKGGPVPALPRPDLPPGAHRELSEALHDLHHRAGWPSLRTLAKASGCSHTTVSKALSEPRLPSWGVLELLVEAMDGEVERFHRLWLEAGAASSGERAPPQLAGRLEELAAVRRHLDSGSGLLVVAGEAGIGKTKLVATAVAATDVLVAQGACLPLSQTVPLMPVADALGAAWAVDEGRHVEAVLAEGPNYLRPALGSLLPELETPDVGADQRQVFQAVERVLAGPGRGSRLALVLEDLHWADPGTLDLLEHLVARRAPVALMGTWRQDDPSLPEETRAWWDRIRRHPLTAVVRLGPLDRTATAALMAGLGVDPTPAAVDRVYRRSRGQPLFTEQLAVQPDDGGALPELLADLLGHRLGQLGDDARLVTTALGVADRRLLVTDLAELTEVSGAQLDAALHELADRYLLAGLASTVALRHPLLAEAARARLLPHERQRMHRRLAGRLARARAPSAAEVAEHWRAAGDRVRELDWREAAARAASSRGADGQAAAEWLRVLELWPDDRSRSAAAHAEALVEAMRCLGASSAVDRAAHLVPQALELVPNLDPTAAARVLATAGSVQGAVHGPVEAIPLLEHALALHEELPPSADHARALSHLAGQLRGMGRYDEAGELISRAVVTSEQIADGPLLRTNLELLAWHQSMAGDTEAAAATRARADTTAELPPLDVVRVGVVRTDALLVTGATCAEVEASAAPGLALARHEGLSSHAVALLQCNTAQALISAGRVAAAWDLIEPVTQGRPGVDNFPVFIERLWLESLRGRDDEALRHLETVSAVPITGVTNRAERTERAALVHLWRGDPRTAELLLTHTLEELRDSVGSERGGALLTLLARAVADLTASPPAPGAVRALVEVRRSLLRDPLAASTVAADSQARAEQWDAELGRLTGRPDEGAWGRAANTWDGLERPHDSAYCRWRGAQAALAIGHGTVAARLLRRAAADAREHVPLSAAIAATSAYAPQS
jgi:tetratricopeptide (TPR) repeat protein